MGILHVCCCDAKCLVVSSAMLLLLLVLLLLLLLLMLMLLLLRVTVTVIMTLLLSGIQCYQLESVCRLRKYLSFVELAVSFVTSRVIFVSGWSELVKAQVSMCCCLCSEQ